MDQKHLYNDIAIAINHARPSGHQVRIVEKVVRSNEPKPKDFKAMTPRGCVCPKMLKPQTLPAKWNLSDRKK